MSDRVNYVNVSFELINKIDKMSEMCPKKCQETRFKKSYQILEIRTNV